MKAKALRRLPCLGLCAVLAMGSLAGCGKQEDAGTPKAGADEAENSADEVQDSGSEEQQSSAEEEKPDDVSMEGVELTVWAPAYWVGQKMEYKDNEVWQEVQKRLGVKLNFIHPAIGQEQEQFNIMISSGELPDIISAGWMGDSLYSGGLDKFVDDNVLIRVNELVDQYAPDYKSAIENVVEKEEQKEFYTDSGNMVQFYAISPYEEWAYNGLLLRKDWVDELGMGEPETLEDYENLFIAFQEQKGAKSPLILPAGGIDGTSGFILSAWDIGPSFYQENGVVKYGPIQPGFKEYLTLMNKWYGMGLIDKDVPTRDDDACKRMMTTGESGAIIHSPDTVGAWMEGVSELAIGKYPVRNSGDRVQYRLKTYQARPPYAFAITTACKNPEAAVKFLNYGYTQEGYMLYNYGIEGETYNLTGETVTYNGIEYPMIEYTDRMLNNPDYPILDAIQVFKVHIGPFIRFEHEGNPAMNMNNAEIRQKLTEGADTTLDMPMVTLTAEEGQDYAKVMNQVSTYQETAVLQFIMGTRSLDEFDAYVEDMKQLEIEKAISYQQSAYDRYQAR